MSIARSTAHSFWYSLALAAKGKLRGSKLPLICYYVQDDQQLLNSFESKDIWL